MFLIQARLDEKERAAKDVKVLGNNYFKQHDICGGIEWCWSTEKEIIFLLFCQKSWWNSLMNAFSPWLILLLNLICQPKCQQDAQTHTHTHRLYYSLIYTNMCIYRPGGQLWKVWEPVGLLRKRLFSGLWLNGVWPPILSPRKKKRKKKRRRINTSHVFKCRRNPGQHVSRVSERNQLWIDLGLGRGNQSQKKKKKKRTTINKQSSRRDGKQQGRKCGAFNNVSDIEVWQEVYFISTKLHGPHQSMWMQRQEHDDESKKKRVLWLGEMHRWLKKDRTGENHRLPARSISAYELKGDIVTTSKVWGHT